MKKRWYLVPFSFFLACLILAGIDRFSYRYAGEELYNYGFETNNSLNSVVQILQAKDWKQVPKKLVNSSDIIVQGIYKGNRKATGHGFYTPVTVEKVYKGNRSFVGRQIFVLEDDWVFPYTRYINPGGKAYLPLQRGDSYLLLLEKVSFDPMRKLTAFENSQYYPITQTAAGAYRLSKKKQTKVFSWRKKPETLNSLKGYDLPVEDPRQLNLYYQLKTGIFRELGISQ